MARLEDLKRDGKHWDFRNDRPYGEAMTNKSEMVSVPRELLERLAKEIDHLLGFTYAANVEECRVEVDALIALLATPAEDIRAVAEEPEPFGYWRVPNEAPLQGMFLLWEADGPYGNSESHIASAMEAGFSVTKLYHHPQRPVASEPETLFQKGQRLAKEGHGLSNLWGNCTKDSDMDEVQRGMEAYWQSQ